MLTKQFRELNRQAQVIENHKKMTVKEQPQEIFTDKDIIKFLNRIYSTKNRYRLTMDEIRTLKQIHDRL